MSEPNPYRVPSVGRVDRHALVTRHTVRVADIDPRAPLQVGNGRFAYAVDVTGLQTFPEAYPSAPTGTLLGTFAEWAWHAIPAERPYALEETLGTYRTARGPVRYVDLSTEAHDAPGQSPAEAWLRGNPHRLDLGRIGLAGFDDPGALEAVEQWLDPWSGVIESRFVVAGRGYRVTTAVHPELDVIGIVIRAARDELVSVRLRFPYGSTAWGDAADWGRPEAHTTTATSVDGGWQVRRDLGATTYHVAIGAPHAQFTRPGDHELVLARPGALELSIGFGSVSPRTPGAREVIEASRAGWAAFWSSGAAVDLSGSSDPRAPELERRIVLSQYLTRVNGTGAMPPAETGLMCASWRGRSHLEMHWLHGAHLAAWARPDLLAPSLGWYATIGDLARATATRQGLAGARWPKQVDPSGAETPSSIGPFLVWQQPHPVYLAELLYRADPTSATLERWADLVGDTADWMAAFPTPGPDGLHLGPPIVPAQESYHPLRATSADPTFELAYWAWGLDAAARWWERMGRQPPARWREVADGLVRPMIREGTYAALATPPCLVRDDHPSMLMALGVVPPTRLIDPAVMAATLDDVLADWRWETTWGWDYPIVAMTATRLGRMDDALAALLHPSPRNEWLANGHLRQGDAIPVYLPANGALLAAIALMVGGWDGAPPPSWGPGWSVAHEGLVRFP